MGAWMYVCKWMVVGVHCFLLLLLLSFLGYIIGVDGIGNGVRVCCAGVRFGFFFDVLDCWWEYLRVPGLHFRLYWSGSLWLSLQVSCVKPSHGAGCLPGVLGLDSLLLRCF